METLSADSAFSQSAPADYVQSTPVWLYALDDQAWQRILALGAETAELPLYGTPPAWQRGEPHEMSGDLWYVAAALLAVYELL